MMDFEALIAAERQPLVSRTAFMLGGDRDAAEDLVQEAFTRAWQRMPPGIGQYEQRAWLRSASRHLAIDELRRRSRRPVQSIDDADPSALPTQGIGEPDAAREALAQLPVHERFVLLMRFEAGFSHAEIAGLLDISEEAARKRISRARLAFVRRYRSLRDSQTPLVLLLLREDRADPYVSWLGRAGAEVRLMHRGPSERELLLADGLLFSGSMTDIDPALYGDEMRFASGELDLHGDRLDLAVINAALAVDMPFIGVCRGHQLLNIASGGDLYQDVIADGLTARAHDRDPHVVHTSRESKLRRLVGRRSLVESEHHQAVRRLGRNVCVSATSTDGVVETIERHDRSFAVGFQWRPERGDNVAGNLVAEAFIDAMAARA